MGTSAKYSAEVLSEASRIYGQQSGIAGIQASNERRDEEWDFQMDTAAKELDNLAVQLESAEVRLALARNELSIHELQISQTEEANAFLEGKYTNKELYSWMVGRLSKLYFDAYKLALKMAKKAERAYYYELGLDQGTSSFIKGGYWSNLKKGLLAGEGLHNDLKRLDMAYTENNVRELELTKQYSLATYDASALIALRETGRCDFDLSELMFDLDHPGHYYRRIKSVSLTIPCVAGPFTGVSARLVLKTDKLRSQALVSGGSYTADENYQTGSLGLEAIATSTGQNDSGVFELNFNDARYLPFEYRGAISQWTLELPNANGTSLTEADVLRQFDYDTISDAILTIRYTAREGGSRLKSEALSNAQARINDALSMALDSDEGLYRVVSMKSEFPTELHQFLNPQASQISQETSFTLTDRHLPYVVRSLQLQSEEVIVLLKLKDSVEGVSNSQGGVLFSLLKDTTLLDDPESTVYNDASYAGGLHSTKIGHSSNLSGPQDTWTLKSDSSKVAGLSSSNGSLITTVDIGGTDYHRIASDVVDDILIVINYKKA